MRPISRKTLFSLTSSSSSSSSLSPYTVLISRSLTSSPHSSRRHDEDSRNVRVSVWWDFENCNLPVGVNVFKVAQTITAAIRANGIKGPVTITAYGDVLQLSRPNQEALSFTGINITHVPRGGKNSADQSLLVDLMYWVSQNPPPAHIFLISGDRDFASILHRLRMSNYNILLASIDSAPNVLRSAASIMWYWNSLVRGENLSGKHYNQPPDGPYGSWYGHYKVPIEDPFAVAEPSAPSLPDAVSDIRPIPKSVFKQIRHILSSYPKGMSIGELRAELSKSSVPMDKNFYGYKRFSRFLLSMPHILKLRPEGDGQFTVRGVPSKASESFNSCLYSSNGEESCKDGAGDDKSVSPLSPDSNLKELQKSIQQPPTSSEKVVNLDSSKTMQHHSVDKKVIAPVGAQGVEVHQPPAMKQDSESKPGFFKRICLKLYGDSNKGSEMESQNVSKKCMDSGDISKSFSHATPGKSSIEGDDVGKTKIEASCMESQLSASGNQLSEKGKNVSNADACSVKSNQSPGFLNHAKSWFKIGSNKSNSGTVSDLCSEKPNLGNSNSQKHKILLKDSFWSDMESFMGSPRASLVISGSRTREQLAQSLSKEGPSATKDLNSNDLLDLVDVLISEKKWVKECESETLPFKLVVPVAERSSLEHNTHSTNGLRSIFLKVPDQDGERKIQNITHAGVSTAPANKMPLDKSRSDIMPDVKKLVNEVLKLYPEGYNIGGFRKLFLEKYGYHLDLQKLGYDKLASLLQILPGVKIESTYMYTSSKVQDDFCVETSFPNVQENNDSSQLAGNSDRESDSSNKNDDSDSSWDELGPLSNLTLDAKEMRSVSSSEEVKETRRETYPGYESSASDDEFSDSEAEVSDTIRQAERKGKPGINMEDSSLLQILDSWYSSKESDNKDKSESVDGPADCSSTTGEKPTESPVFTSKSEINLENFPRRLRPQKSYSFVSDTGNDKEKVVLDGILGSLKKSAIR